MNKIALAIGLAVAAAAATQAQAADELALAKSKNCLACHAVDHKVVGPAYKDVAAKHPKVAELENAILKGSSGKWGPVPMPANPQVSPAEAKKLAEWIVSLK